MDVRDLLGRSRLPALVVIGAHDPATTPEQGHYIADASPGAQKAVLDARIFPTSSGRDEFNRIVFGFLAGERPMSDAYERGMKVRRAVLGDAHVDRATAGITDFNRDFQDLITRYAWGEIWSRPGPRPEDPLLHGADRDDRARRIGTSSACMSAPRSTTGSARTRSRK